MAPNGSVPHFLHLRQKPIPTITYQPKFLIPSQISIDIEIKLFAGVVLQCIFTNVLPPLPPRPDKKTPWIQTQKGTNLMPIFRLSGTNLQSSLQHTTPFRRGRGISRFHRTTSVCQQKGVDGAASKTFPTRKTWAPYYHHLHPSSNRLLYNIILIADRRPTDYCGTPGRAGFHSEQFDSHAATGSTKRASPIHSKEAKSVHCHYLSAYNLRSPTRRCVNQLSSRGKLSI